MSGDDRVVSLAGRRPGPTPKVAATMVFANDQLRMPMDLDATAPVWTTLEPISVQTEDGDEPRMVHARFGMIDHSPDGTSGYAFENEHGVSAELYFEREVFMALQGAALSACPLTLFITFVSSDGAPPSLMLAIERRTA